MLTCVLQLQFVCIAYRILNDIFMSGVFVTYAFIIYLPLDRLMIMVINRCASVRRIQTRFFTFTKCDNTVVLMILVFSL